MGKCTNCQKKKAARAKQLAERKANRKSRARSLAKKRTSSGLATIGNQQYRYTV
jgi:hypothetical protein